MCDEARHLLSVKASRDRTVMITLMVTSAIVLVIFGGSGLIVAFMTGGALGDSRAAFSASLVGIVIGTDMVLAIGGLYVILLVHKTIRRETGHINARLDEQAATFRLLLESAGDQLGARRNGDDHAQAR